MHKGVLDESSTEDGVSDVNNEVQEGPDFAADKIIKSHVISSMALGLVPVPLFDIAALTTTQLSLLKQLCKQYDVPFNNFELKTILTSLIGGSLPIMSVVGLSSLIKVIPGFGSIAGMASLSMTAGSVTYAVGKVFKKHFESGGTFDDFDSGKARQLLKSEFEYGKSFVSSLEDDEKSNDTAKVEKP